MELFTIYFLSTCPDRQPAGKHCLWNYRYIHRYPAFGIYQRRADTCFFWRHRNGIVYGNLTDSFSRCLFGIVGLRRRVAQQAEGHARGLCHCSLLDVGHGIGHHFHFPISRIRSRPFRLSVWKHPDYYIERHRLAGRTGNTAYLIFLAFFAPDNIRSVRPRVCPFTKEFRHRLLSTY